MKHQIRILGIDDAPFTFHDKYTSIIGVVMRGGEYLECVLRNQVTIDGTEATEICAQMINTSRHHRQLKVVMIDGACLGGFNVVDIDTLSQATQIPVITVTRDKPNQRKIKYALQKNFKDWETRFEVMQKGRLYKIPTAHNPMYIKCSGISLEEAKEIINISTIRGVIPEPIRVAHLIASGITRGESYGKA
jgi:uncharacterized protein